MEPSFAQVPPLVRRLVALAERDPLRAARVATRLADAPWQDTLAESWARFAAGWALLGWERFDQARAQFDAALAGAEAAPPLAARCRLGHNLIDFAQQPDAGLVARLEASAADLERHGAAAEATHARIIAAALLNVLGQPRAALALLADQAARAPLASDTLDARWRRVRAAAAYALGDYAAAAHDLDAAAAIFVARGCRAELAKCWYEQGALALRAGRVEAAVQCYERAARQFARLDLPLRRALCAHDSSHALLRLGAYDRALAEILRALDYFFAIGRKRDVARCALLLGNLFWYASAWEAALASYRSAEAMFAATGMVAGDRFTARRNQALVFRETGLLNEAWALLGALERDARADGAAADLAAVTHDQAALLAAMGRSAAALSQLGLAREHWNALDDATGAAETWLDQGWLLLAAGDHLAARRAFVAAAPALRPTPSSRWRNDYGLARCAELAGDAASAGAAYLRACSVVGELRSRLRSETLSSAIFLQAEQLFVHALQHAVRGGDAEAALAIGEGQRALTLSRLLGAGPPELSGAHLQEREALLAELRQLATVPTLVAEPAPVLLAFGELLLSARRQSRERTAASGAIDDGPFDLAAARALLVARYGQGWTVLAVLPLAEELVIVVVTPEATLLQREPLDEALECLIEQGCDRAYRRYTYDDHAWLQGQAARPWQALEQLGARLIPPVVRERLGPDHRLIVLPAGPLHTLPWAALRSDGAWLVERAIVQVAPSLLALRRLNERTPGPPAALLIGCRSFAGRAPELPGVADELEAVAAATTLPCDRLLDAQASCAQLSALAAAGRLARYGLIHIASHAQLLASRRGAAHLKLWDGDLQLAKIAAMDLAGALVVLSACEGADAELLPGEEALSLSRAWIEAGARAVVASLWPVYDRAVLALMARFHAELAAHGDAALALTRAQRSLAADPHHLLAGPRCWAGFLLFGDAAPT
jgi:CHAT domain-containing protein/tetratricopeptide (TPR) repeat protein